MAHAVGQAVGKTLGVTDLNDRTRRNSMANKGRGMVRQPATKSPKMQKKIVKNKIAAGLWKKK
jgi:hypothetical protein